MRRPASLFEQYKGKARAELGRGCGLVLQPHPCDLEPPWDLFDRGSVNVWDCLFNDWEGRYDDTLLGVFAPRVHRRGDPLLLPQTAWGLDEKGPFKLAPIMVEQFPEDEETIPKANQLLRALVEARFPVSFEVLGLGAQPIYEYPNGPRILKARRDCEPARGWSPPRTSVRFIVHRDDVKLVESQLLAHYPNSAVVVGEEMNFAADILPGHDLHHGFGCGTTFHLDVGHLWPLRRFTRLEPDPLGVAVAAMDSLAPHEWALLQILFQPARRDWAQTTRQSLMDPYDPGKFIFLDVHHKLLGEKFSSPLFAVSIRVAALRETVYRQLLGWAEQFTAPPQRLEACGDEVQGDWSWSVTARCTFRPGVLLNVDELASMVHLPAASVAGERLRRIPTRTRPVAETAPEPGAIGLGDNVHRGKKRVARVSASLRARHCYIAGASGTGKSTLLLNMILQDLAAGHGVAVLDPHGDLVADVLRRVPKQRVNDVVYFDPADEQHPFALNIIEAKDEAERERIVQETMMALKNYFPASWGPRLERILMNTLYTVTESIPGATLGDVERMLVDLAFRNYVVSRCRTERLLHYWRYESPRWSNDSCEAVLNKLSPFLTRRVVRNIICQRHSAIHFDQLINDGKVLLANLSSGELSEPIASMFGSFLVSKIVSAAFRRARTPREKRRPFYLYIDEFQAFMSVSIDFERILAEARKYRLVLTLANQYVGQVDASVRQAIFGNVGVMVVFRLGVDDANLAAKEMGVFTPAEIMNLEVGEAIARAGGSATAFNVKTYPPPVVPQDDPTARIIAETRRRCTKPRALVEQLISGSAGPTPSPGHSGPAPPKSRRRRKGGQSRPGEPHPPDFRDPSEDDLVK